MGLATKHATPWGILLPLLSQAHVCPPVAPLQGALDWAKDHNIVKSWVHEPSQDSCSPLESLSPAASILRGMDCGNRAGMRRLGCGERHQEARLLPSFPALLNNMQLCVHSTCSLFLGLQLC